MDKTMLEYVLEKEQEYLNFMGIDEFPEIQLEEISITPEGSSIKRNVYACTGYEKDNIKYYLGVSPELINSKADYLLYHEFTHILDREWCRKHNLLEKGECFGYTFFHAAQIEMMKLLGIDSVRTSIKFDLTEQLNILGCKGLISVRSYVCYSYCQAKNELLNATYSNEKDFLVALEWLFNFWGLRSICQMNEKETDAGLNNLSIDIIKSELNRLNVDVVEECNKLLNSFLCDTQIKQLNVLCQNMIDYVVKERNLIPIEDTSRQKRKGALGGKIIGVLPKIKNEQLKILKPSANRPITHI